MTISNKKYFQEDLNNDVTGNKWQIMLSSVIEKANFLEFTIGTVDSKVEIVSKISEAKRHIQHLGISKQLVNLYSTNIYFQRKYPFHYIIARLSIDAELKIKIISYKTLLDFVIKKDADIFNPAFYFNDSALLWTNTTMGFANILITEKQRSLWIKQGFILNKI